MTPLFVPLLVLAASACAWFVARAARWWKCERVLARIPTPSQGTGHLRALSSPRRHRTLLRWSGEVGPVFLLRLLWGRMVVVADPALAAPLFKRSLGAVKVQELKSFDELLGVKGHPNIFSSLSTDSHYWKLVRKGVAPAFAPQNLRKGFPHVVHAAQEVCQVLSSLPEGQPADLDELLQRESLDVIGAVGFQKRFGAVQGYGRGGDNYGDLFTHGTKAVTELMLRVTNPLRRHLWFLPSVREGSQHGAAFRAEIALLLKEIRARGAPAEDDTSLVAHLLRLKDPFTGGPLSDKHLLTETLTFVFAGFDTTGHTMAWTLYHLCQHPEAAERVCSELRGLGLLATPGTAPRAVEFEDLGRMHFLSACIKESMRLLPVAADGLVRVFPTDQEIGGYQVPAGVPVWLHIFNFHHNTLAWDEPMQYKPERWLLPGTEFVPVLAGTGAKTTGGLGLAAAPAGAEEGRALRFIPFGEGARHCVGKNLAQINYTATLATLLGHFSFTLAAQMRGPGGAEDCDVVRFTLQPRDGMWLLCTPRSTPRA